MLTNKIRSIISTMVLGLAALVAAPSMLAQETVARANVPFDFQYGSTHLKAGRYNINMIDNQILQLRGRDSAMGVVLWNDTGRGSSTTGKLVFHRYGDQYILRQVWLPNESNHIELPKSKTERRLQEFAQNNSPRPASVCSGPKCLITPSGDVEVALLESPR